MTIEPGTATAPAATAEVRAQRTDARGRRAIGLVGPIVASLAVFLVVWQAIVAIGAALALVVGVVLARSRLAERLLSPYLVAAQATPILALAPLIALWFGTGLPSKLVITTLIVFFPVAVATMVGLRSVDPRLIEMARAFRATNAQVVRRVEVPAALPAILGGMRVGITLAVIGAIIAEWAGGDRGLGVLINVARGSLFDIPLMFATLATLALLGVALYLVKVLIERRLVGDR
jgi:NitT/TauT family transport system permease protein